MRDLQYFGSSYAITEQDHRYGEKVHLLNDTVLRTLLARLGSPETFQPEINWLISHIYHSLVNYVINNEFPHKEIENVSRMIAYNEAACFLSELIDPDTKVVIIDLARAGMLPSMVCFEYFNNVMNPKNIRLDHIFINRKVDEHEHVVGSNVSGHKIGGDIDNAIIIVPDPMGATGRSIKRSIEVMTTAAKGTPKKIIALHLIITPEYLNYMHKYCPDLIIYGLRFDRGLSDTDVLKSIPGTYKERERGLNEKQYIVPGAGGLGEVINNSFV